MAYVTSVNESLEKSSDKDKKQAIDMMTVLRKEKPNIEKYFETHPLEIVEELLNITWDSMKFNQIFDTDVEYFVDGYTIDFGTFVKSLNFVLVSR